MASVFISPISPISADALGDRLGSVDSGISKEGIRIPHLIFCASSSAQSIIGRQELRLPD